MEDFNPDAYLAQKTDSGFDPDAYLAQKGPQTSALGAAGRGALDAVPFGTKAAAGVESAVGNGSYEKYLAELDSLLSADKSQHPVAHYAGETAGTIAPFAIPGVGEALAGEGIASRAGIGAGLGALQAGSNNRNAAELPTDLLKGAGIGALVNPAVGALGDAIGNGASKLANSEPGGRLGASQFADANGLNPMSLRKLAQMSGENPETAAQEMSAKLDKIVPENYYTPTSSVNDKMKILQQLQEQSGGVIGQARKAGAAADQWTFPEGDQAIRDLVEHANNYKDLANPEGADLIKNAAATLQAIKDKGELNFDTMHQIKTSVGQGYNNPMNVKPGTDTIYSTLSKHLDSAMDRFGPKSGMDPSSYQKARETYAMTSKLLPLMQRGAGREVKGALTPMKGVLGMGALMSTHPAAALIPAAKAAQEIMAPEMVSNIGMGMRGALSNASVPNAFGPSVTNMASNHLNIPAPYQATFKQATQGLTEPSEIQKKNAVTDFVLQQRDPSYAKAKADQSQQ